MRSIKVTCLVLLAGLTCLGLALVAAAPGQQAGQQEPSTDPGAGTGSESSVPAPASAGRMRTAAESSGSASERPAAPAPDAEVGAAQADQALWASKRAQQALNAALSDDPMIRSGYVSPGTAGRYDPSYSYGGVTAADPEVAKWMEEGRKAEAEQGQLLAKFAQTTDEKQRAEIKASLAKVLQRQFDLQLQQREREVSQIEARVKKLREMIAKRNRARQTIVAGRLDQLVNEAEGMGWVAPTGPMSPSGSYQYYSRPGLNRGGASGGYPGKGSSDAAPAAAPPGGSIGPGGAGIEAPRAPAGGSIGPGGAGIEAPAAPAPLAVPGTPAGGASDALPGASGPQKPASKY